MAICAQCTYLNPEKQRDYGTYYCDKKDERHLATDPECGSFCRAYSREQSTIDNMIDHSKSRNNGGGCFLTTILCNILKMDDNNIYLNTMRNFRDNILQKDEKYKSLLVEYDIIGPKIANILNNDPLKEKVAKMFFERDIVPIVNLINSNEYEKAINAYWMMTTTIKNFYGISSFNISIDEINNADIEKSGHGKYIRKKITI